MFVLKTAAKASLSYVMGGLFAIIVLEPIVSATTLPLLIGAFTIGLPLFTLLVVLLVTQGRSVTAASLTWTTGIISTGVLTLIVVVSSLSGSQAAVHLAAETEVTLHSLIVLITSLVASSLALSLMNFDGHSGAPRPSDEC